MPLQATAGAATYDAFGGGVTAANYIEDVFSTYLYTGNSTSGGTQTITNSIDLSTKGGMVWIKGRSAASNHIWTDTTRGAGASATNNNALASNLTDAEDLGGSSYDFLSAFNTDGFTVKQGGTTAATRGTNYDAVTYASWTFRKQAKFFDVVTYTGDGSTTNRAISHNLGSVPGCIIVKRSTGGTSGWIVYHRSLASGNNLELNQSSASSANGYWSVAPTSTDFTLAGMFGAGEPLNQSGSTYVAYLFAHDAGGFGASGTDNVISCGSFTTNGSGNVSSVSLGYEPQWVLYKTTDVADNWRVVDNMRGMPVTATTGEPVLKPNLSDAEQADAGVVVPNATGFSINGALPSYTYIYIAIRRGPMRTPTTGTSVFEPKTMTATQANLSITGVGFSPDLVINGVRSDANYGQQVTDRLRGVTKQVFTEYDSAENTTNGTAVVSLNMNGISLGADTAGTGWNAYSGYTSVKWMFRRAPGFFDVVCYTGTGSATTFSHNLGAVPELMIVKRRSAADDWWVYDAATGNTKYQVLNSTATPTTSSTAWNNTTPTSSVFTVGTGTPVNASAGTYVAYLFATVAGVSKVGSYTGTGALQTVNCGFTGGARFVLIKRTDSTGDWYVYDSARGISSGTDPYLLINSTAAEVTGTNYVDTTSTGFQVTAAAPAGLNASGGTYIFLAVA